jgi:hypothetical protein
MKKLACLVVAMLIPVGAHAAPRMISRSGDWGVYSYERNGSPTCYALSIPRDSAPSDVEHGKNYFLIAPAEKGQGKEPQAIIGYKLQSGSMIKLSVGDQTFKMSVQDQNAWVSDKAREPELIKALRLGSRMALEATSARGTHTSYTYSLDGVSAALDRVAHCK